ncbi:patatin-like phospholipase family protein [Aeromonas veronii]|uniref:patatin-like phospholipase family protein n=1 Tax=Aeromonas veronii TaxID=654 RepID=UPI003F7AE3C0
MIRKSFKMIAGMLKKITIFPCYNKEKDLPDSPKNGLEAFAVFEGGGVKGAALAGALSATQECNIKFVGYGGSSAGAIVAYLSAIGYSPKELLHFFLSTSFSTFLDKNQGKELKKVKNKLSQLSKFKQRQFLWLPPILNYYISSRLRLLVRIVLRIHNKKGYYCHNGLRNELVRLTRIKYPELISSNNNFNFINLYELTGIDLKIVVSDVGNGRAIIFDHENIETRTFSVIESICASASYPFLFQPVTNSTNDYLVDGGLSSNLPTFIFKKNNYKRIPILSFDLCKEVPPSTFKEMPFSHYALNLINTALDASDNIMHDLVDAIPLKVLVPNNIDTLDFNVNKLDILELYQMGRSSTSASLQQSRIIQKSIASDGDLTMLARARFGEKLYIPILESILKLFILDDKDEARAWLYTYASSLSNTITAICRHSINSTTSSKFKSSYIHSLDNMDIDIVECWKKGKIIIKEFESKTMKDSFITRLCLPIAYHTDILLDVSNNIDYSEVIGVIVVELNIKKEYCYWLDNDILESNFQGKMATWVAITNKLMTHPYQEQQGV